MKLSTLLSGVLGGAMGYTLSEIGYSYDTKEFYIILGLMLAYGMVQLIDVELWK